MTMRKPARRTIKGRGDFPRYKYPHTYRPVDVVHLRQELVNTLRHTPLGRDFSHRLAVERRWRDQDTGLVNHLVGMDHTSVPRWLEYADLYLVSAQMENLARQAGAKMPEVAVYEEDLPAPRGLLIWANATPARMDLASSFGDREPRRADPLDSFVRDVPMRGILWSVCPTKYGPGLAVVGLGDMKPMNAAILEVYPDMKLDPVVTKWPTSFGDTNGLTFGESGIWPGSPIGSTLVATWFLMNQTVSVSHAERIPLPGRTPGERKPRADQEVRTVTLRRAKTVSEYGREPVNPGRGYSVQFPVEGHWHTYWTGHGRAVKKIRWVDTYIKGPEHAPMIGGERVSVLKR